MPTVTRALRVKLGMERGTGRAYVIWFDPKYACFRVLPRSEYRPGLEKLQGGEQA